MISVAGLTMSMLPAKSACVPVAERMYFSSTARPYLAKSPFSCASQSGAKAPPIDE